RISIDSTPPIRKNTSPVTMKRRPTEVWLTAASAPQPGQLPQTRPYSRCSRALFCCCSLMAVSALQPCREVSRGMGMYGEFHVGMAGAAELGTLSVIGPRLVSLRSQYVGPARQHVGLAAQPRYPDGMDDVAAGQLQVHR